PFLVVVDYAHTPDALERVLTTARKITSGRLAVVFGCGGDRDRTKRPIMGEIAARLADRAWITSDNPRSENPDAIIAEIAVGVAIDSRTRQVGEAFFAIVGHRLNGHVFLADAAARGAACVVVHTLPDDPPANVPLVLVEDTTRALGRLAAWHRSKFSVPVVAITGSIGKTTA